MAPPGSPGDPVNFTVNVGDTVDSVGARLQEAGIITNARVFGWYVQRKGGLDLKPGYFALRPMDDMGNIVAALRTSPTQTFTNVTFPEGYAVARMGARLEKTVPRLSAANFVAAATSGQIQSELAPGVGNLEGLLFPDSYQIGGSETEAQIVARLSQQMTRVANSVGIQNSQSLVGRSPYEVLVVASMIEKEAKVDEDRALIARVIYNRLFVGTPLQIDATLYYGQDPRRRSAPCRPPTRRTTRTSTSACRPRRSPTRARSRSRPRCTRRRTPTRRRAPAASRASGCTTCWRTRAGARLRHHLRGPPEKRREGAGGRTARVSRPAAPVRSAAGRGWPASSDRPSRHSLSPAMHNAAFAACGLDWRLRRLRGPGRRAGGALDAVRALGLAGLSVTMPHKADVAALVDERSATVERAAARPTPSWWRRTAGSGARAPTGPASSTRCGSTTASTRRAMAAVVLGAGGAARAVVLALADAGCREVVVVNRTATAAAAAAALAGDRGRVGGPDDVAGADLVVNATPLGMGEDGTLPLDPRRLRAGQVVADLVYHPLPHAAARRGGGAGVPHRGRPRDARPPGRPSARAVDRAGGAAGRHAAAAEAALAGS